jgi:hypothetical protein
VALTFSHSRVIPRGSKYPRFDPYQPPPPPSGSYDPILDAQQAASQRGLGDVRQDTSLAGTRAAVDYGLGVEGLNRSYGRGMEDFTTSRDRGMQDYGQQLGRGEEDYTRNVGLLQRSYQQLGRREAEGARSRHVISGGLALRAAQIRAENEAIDRQPLDTGISRLRQDVSTGQTRLGEDYARGTGRLGQDRDLGVGQLALGYDRGVSDRRTALSRAEREGAQFGLDVGASKAYQAGQSGWAPPERGAAGGMPKNEFVKPDGTHYKVIISNGWRYEVDPSGRVLNKRKR